MTDDLLVRDMPMNPLPEPVRDAARRLVLRWCSDSPETCAAVLEALGLDEENGSG